MKIREGAYYRRRDGEVVGPMVPSKHRTWAWVVNDHAWYEDGRFLNSGVPNMMDLISEVYVSDTPPADPPAPEVKTLRDEFAGRALTGMMADHTAPDKPPEFFADLAYKYANAMMEARKK
jgi:hypothetical protein